MVRGAKIRGVASEKSKMPSGSPRRYIQALGGECEIGDVAGAAIMVDSCETAQTIW
jgi:hypothetical protein